MTAHSSDEFDVSTRIKTAALYARFSCDMQRETSNDDQLRESRNAAERMGWTVVDDFIRTDSAKSGLSLQGRSIVDLVQAAKKTPRPFDVVMVHDSSRLGRNQSDVLRLFEILQHYGVHLYLVSYHLCSTSPSFKQVLSTLAQMDENQSKAQGARVRRGKTGAFERGYWPGGRCFGYKNVPEEHPTKTGEYGRPLVVGCRLQIDRFEAATVTRIFHDYIGGKSLNQVARDLNRDEVVPPKAAAARCHASWSKECVDSILSNKRFTGLLTWNREYQVMNPESGRYENRTRPKSEWKHRFEESLRIIPDEVFDRVLATRAARRGVAKSLGGSSGPSAEKNLFSGLLKCGVCGKSMTLQSPTYLGCKMHRSRGTCSNGITVRYELVEKALLGSLQARLEDPAQLESVVNAVVEQLRSAEAVEKLHSASLGQERSQLLAEHQLLSKEEDNLVAAIKAGRGSGRLLRELAGTEQRLGELKALLGKADRYVPKGISRKEVRAFVQSQVKSFVSVLAGDRSKMKAELRKRVSSLTMLPHVDADVREYQITGDIGLFLGSEDVPQGGGLESTPLWYTFPVSEVVGATRLNRRNTHALQPVAKPFGLTSQVINEGDSGETWDDDADGALDFSMELAELMLSAFPAPEFNALPC